MPSKFNIDPVNAGFVARVELNTASASVDDVGALRSMLSTYPVLVIPDQKLTYEEQIEFAKKFGPLDQVPDIADKGESTTAATRFDRQVDGDNLDSVKHLLATLGTTVWHTDGTYKAIPAHLSMLYGITVTRDGGETQYADLRAAYDNLPAWLKDISEGLVAEHNTLNAATIVGAENLSETNVKQFSKCFAYDIVRTLPDSGRKTLYLSAHAARIIGLPTAQGRMILRELTEIATSPEFTYTHQWTPGDLVIWDNRCTMHRLRPYRTSDHRIMQRVSTEDTEYGAIDPRTVKVSPYVFDAL